MLRRPRDSGSGSDTATSDDGDGRNAGGIPVGLMQRHHGSNGHHSSNSSTTAGGSGGAAGGVDVFGFQQDAFATADSSTNSFHRSQQQW